MATEFVGIELQLMGYEGVRSDLQQLDHLLKSFRGRKQFNAGFDEAKKQVVAYKGELEKLQRIQSDLAKKGVVSEGLNNKIDDTRNKLRDAQQAVREFGLASRQAGQTFMQTFNSMSSRIAHVGSAMQSLGNALTRLSSPFRRFTSGLLMGAGYKALNLFTEGLSNTFERSDTMRNYDRSLKALGLDVEKTFSVAGKEAKTAKENLDDAVQGLPTSLDEIMAAQKVYAGATGEMVSSTKTAIAANNAFLASTTDSRQQRVLQRYFVALASGANLTATQWAAMQRNMPLAFRKVGEAMGYMDLDQFQADLGSSNEKAQEFLKTFQELGTSGVIKDAAMVMTKSWSGLSSNIKIAVTRMGQGVIDTLNETFEKATGRDLLSHLLGIDANGNRTNDGIRDWINNMSTAVQNWVKAHPEEITNFFEALKGIDWTSIVRGFAEGTLAVAHFLERLAGMAQGKDLSWIGKFMTQASIWGRGLTILGGVLKGLRHPLAFIATLGSRFIGGKMGGLLGRLAAFFGKGKALKEAEDTAKAIPSVTATFKRALTSLSGLFQVFGAVALAGGAGVVAVKSVKTMMNDFNEIVETFKGVDWYAGKEVLTGMAVFYGSFATIGGIIGNTPALGEISAGILVGEAIIGGITGLASLIVKADMAILRSAFEDFKSVADNFTAGMEALSGIKSLPDGVADTIENAVEAYNKIIHAFNGDRDVGGNKRVEGGLKGFDNGKVKTVEEIKEVLQAMLDSADAINEINGITFNTDNIESVTEDFNTALQAIGNIFSRDNLPEAFYYGEGAGASTDFASTVGNINRSLGYLVGEDGVFAKLKELAGMSNASALAQMAKGNISEMLNNLKTAFSGLVADDGGGDYSAAATKMENFANALKSVKVAFKRMQAIESLSEGLGTKGKGGKGNYKATAAINSLISQLEQAFDTNKINQLNTDIQGFVDTVNNLLETISNISTDSGNITIEINLEDKIVGDKKVISDIEAVNDKIKAAVDNIQTVYQRTIQVHLNASVNSSGLGVSNGGGSKQTQDAYYRGHGRAMGGMIYRSRGGNVPFRRRGTDTVPAMLTPGEYVHNKKAVNTFGIDFMRKVNSLDVKGAMNELMHRAGGMANINRGTSITNNYNNNQRVVINNSNNAGAGFTFKSASRFVGAL